MSKCQTPDSTLWQFEWDHRVAWSANVLPCERAGEILSALVNVLTNKRSSPLSLLHPMGGRTPRFSRFAPWSRPRERQKGWTRYHANRCHGGQQVWRAVFLFFFFLLPFPFFLFAFVLLCLFVFFPVGKPRTGERRGVLVRKNVDWNMMVGAETPQASSSGRQREREKQWEREWWRERDAILTETWWRNRTPPQHSALGSVLFDDW